MYVSKGLVMSTVESGNGTCGCILVLLFFFFFKQKTAYEIKECDWSSDVCSSDLLGQSQGWDFANLDDGYELSLVLVVYLTVVLARKMFGATR